MAGVARFLTFCLLLIVVLTDSARFPNRRTLRSWLNYDCGDVCRDRNVTTLYMRADGQNDTLHYLWDFTGIPSVLMALTSTSACLNIDWRNYLARREKALNFTEEPTYSFGVIINKIIEFNDVNDTALIDTAATNVLHPEYFSWRRLSLMQNEDLVYLDMEGNSYHDTAKNITRYGSIKLSLRGFCTVAHSEIQPHMLHTENSTQIDIVLDKIETSQTFYNSRFAIELLVIGEGNPEIPLFVDTEKTLDDEHTPGIFEVIEARMPPYRQLDGTLNAGAYLQWRPVSYNSASRDMSSSTGTMQYSPVKVLNHTSVVEHTMLYSFYGNEVDKLLAQKVTVSLGSKQDGFYKKTRYLTWTFLIGYGTPPQERLSFVVIAALSVAIILFILNMFLFILRCCFRKAHQQGHVYLSR